LRRRKCRLADSAPPWLVSDTPMGCAPASSSARDGAEAFATLDLDLLLPSEPARRRKALDALAAQGFSFQAGGEPFLDDEDDR